MKIKKTFQGSLPENRILNTDSSSQTDTYSCDYINDSSVVVSETEPTTNRKKIWMQKGNNIFDKNDVNIVKNKYISAEGHMGDSSVSSVTGFISVSENTRYIMNLNYDIEYTKRVIFYNESKEILGNTEQSDNNTNFIFITPNNTKFIRTQFVTEQINNTRIEQQLDKIYIKNDNDMYEEFIKKHEEIYSTSEQKIGTWIDGKPLYRKVVEISAPTQHNTSQVVLSLENNCDIKRLDGYLMSKAGSRYNLNSFFTNNDYIYTYINLNHYEIKMKTVEAYSEATATLILEYTKTTD